ncbi:hypothetical protein I6G84_10425 [Cronobacter sakazakii]|uniref:hypothetical protein n=1 Tax=Cronobacter sakazakii TaxID=28141 RepID=UPI0018DD8677|nr:hypothetical protein [Cronobacter sakazakii]MBI0283447.1 hypothetical protein [Cronobacter sakazakii]
MSAILVLKDKYEYRNSCRHLYTAENYGHHLDNVTTAFHESLFSYLEVRDFFHIAITGKIEQGRFCATMPKLQFSFASRNKFIIDDKI